MEVHAHTHSSRRKWTHYLWEFVMLFLAVFCGFLAEYQLEHKIEKDRAKELAKSFYTELKGNADAVRRATTATHKKDSAIQYVKSYFRDSSLSRSTKEFSINFFYAFLVNRPVIFEPRDAILDLLVNSGSLRYFKRMELQKMTMNLSSLIKTIRARNERANQFIADNIDPFVLQHNDDEFTEKMFDLNGGFTQFEKPDHVFPFQLKNADKIDKEVDVNRISLLNIITKTNASLYYNAFDSLNTRLMQELEREYRIK